MIRALVACVAMGVASAAYAAPSDELAKTNEAIESSEARQAKLAGEEKELEAQLADLQEKLVDSAVALDKSTARLDAAEQKLSEIETELAAKEKDAQEKKKRLDGLSRIAVRLSRTPPQAMVLMPADGKSRIQAARALSMVTREIKEQAEKLAADMKILGELQDKAEIEREKAKSLRAAHLEQKKQFELEIRERGRLRDRIASDRKEEAVKAAALARKADSLKDLIADLARKAEEEKALAAKKELKSKSGMAGTRGKLRDFARAKGKLRMPASGKLLSGFGAKEASGDTSKGIKIATGRAATVVAPYDAEVAYSGTFLNYGKLIILKHHSADRGTYHTLLAGLSRIDVTSGDFLLEGEPIGAMSEKGRGELYVELRENNQPINPKPWIDGL